MKKMIFLLLISALALGSQAQSPQTPIMPLGVFHFAYPNLDAVKTDAKDQISVLDEPYQTEIKSICSALEQFNPTIIAIEMTPDQQPLIDSLYRLYRAGKFELQKNESFQLGFRLGKQLNLDKIHCVDDPGRHYESVEAIFNDPARLATFEQFYMNELDTRYISSAATAKMSGIREALYDCNRPEVIKDRLAIYLLHPFKYEEQPGDFTGVDFETGRWYNRNLRIFRNIQRLKPTPDDRILLIIGSEHLNLLNLFFDTSLEFEVVSPLPFLESL